MPRSRQSAPISATGCSVPTSLLAAITETRVVSGRSAAATVSTATRPSASVRPRVTSKPLALEPAAGLQHGRVLDRRGDEVLAPSRARATPRTARLSDSVAPEVKTISSAAAPMSAATWSRAGSTAPRASCRRRGSGWTGLPKRSQKYGSIAVEHQRIHRRGGVMVEVDAVHGARIIAQSRG